ncbi:MAG: restriction endonuclease subunit S [Chloroflexota bacterium]|nr:MAG: restriction endonuclease subunit S [Chloroflexota bacterium]
MKNEWQTVPLGKVLKRVKQEISLDAAKIYKEVTVRLWNKGVVPRGEKQGIEIKTARYSIRAGQLILSRIDVRNGAIGLVPTELDGAIVSGEFWTYEIDQTLLDSKFLEYCVAIPDFIEKSNQTSSGTTNRIRAEEELFLQIEIPLPPLPEQQRIVARIEELARRVEEARGLRKTAVEEADALLEIAVGKVFENQTPIEARLLGRLATKIGSGSTPTGGRASYPSSGIPFIRSQNVRMREFQMEGIAFIDEATHKSMKGTIVQPNDVLLNITGASIGRVACVPDDLKEANINQHVAIIRPTQELHPRYLMYWLSQPKIQEFINSEQKGATRQGFTKQQIEKFNVLLLPLDEQHRIVAHLDNLQQKVDELRRLQAATQKELDALMPSILAKAFAGEL